MSSKPDRRLAPVSSNAPVPPQNLEAEESVLGAMLLSPNAIAAVSEIVEAGDFYRESHAKIYRAALTLYAKNEPVDAITLTDALEELGELDEVGGRIRLHELAALVPATANASHYARIVHEMATLRGLIRAGGEVARLGWERPGETPALVDQAQQLVFDLTLERSRSRARDYAELTRETYERLVELYESGADITGIPSGLYELDELTGGFQSQQLIVIGGRPSMGKSALGMTIAANVAAHQIGVGIFSLEMSDRELNERLISADAKIDLAKLRRPKRLTGEDWKRLIPAVDRQQKLSPYLHVHELSSVTMLALRTEARRMKARHPDIGLIIVDYLQLAESDAHKENRTQEVSEIARALKQLARDLDIAVLALSQLNRGVELRADKRPTLADLRESGEIEQAADGVWLLFRPDYYSDETDKKGIAEIIVAKQRNGPTDTVEVAYLKQYAQFGNLAR